MRLEERDGGGGEVEEKWRRWSRGGSGGGEVEVGERRRWRRGRGELEVQEDVPCSVEPASSAPAGGCRSPPHPAGSHGTAGETGSQSQLRINTINTLRVQTRYTDISIVASVE